MQTCQKGENSDFPDQKLSQFCGKNIEIKEQLLRLNFKICKNGPNFCHIRISSFQKNPLKLVTLTLIGIGEGTFHHLVIFGKDFVSQILSKISKGGGEN